MKIATFDALLQTLDTDGQAQAAQTFADSNSLWVKFIFTDDAPNGNKQAIAQDQYAGIIETGVHKPFKRALGSELSPQHDLVVPIGTVVEMSQEANQVVGLAAVWEPEFPEEAAAIREAHDKGENLNVSWEVFYAESSVDDTGVEWLQGVKTRAVALVGKPAYDGRTPVTAVAANTQEEGEKSMDLEKALERVEKLEGDKATLEQSLAEAKASIEELLELKTEVETLREFKTEVEQERERNALVTKRMAQFSEAGLEMSSEDFEASADKWLSMDDDAFAFVLSQLVSQKPAGDSKSEASLEDGGNTNSSTEDPKELVRQFLSERNKPEKEEK
jgi:hypothetical protein